MALSLLVESVPGTRNPPTSNSARREAEAFLGLRGVGLRLVALGSVLALGDASRLAAAVAQVIELGAAHLAGAHDLDGFDQRRVDREHALHAFAVADLADREALLDAAAVAGD